jgi:hypothetical protein
MSHKLNSRIAVSHNTRGAIMLRQKWSRGQLETRLANLAPCCMEACVDAASILCRRRDRQHPPDLGQ